MVKIDVMSHKLVPKHILLSKKEAEEVLKKHKWEAYQLPKIFITDPCVKALGAKVGDIIKIERQSPTAEVSIAYRLVVETI